MFRNYQSRVRVSKINIYKNLIDNQVIYILFIYSSLDNKVISFKYLILHIFYKNEFLLRVGGSYKIL